MSFFLVCGPGAKLCYNKHIVAIDYMLNFLYQLTYNNWVVWPLWIVSVIAMVAIARKQCVLKIILLFWLLGALAVLVIPMVIFPSKGLGDTRGIAGIPLAVGWLMYFPWLALFYFFIRYLVKKI